MEELKEYIEKNIFKEYEKNEKAHGIDHIKNVILRSFKLSKNMNLDQRFIYVIAAFHDIGHHIDRNKHELISADIFMKDSFMSKYFSLSERLVIKEAIEDHRASSSSFPRSIYGKIISDADRTISLRDTLKRSYEYNRFHNKDMSMDEVFNEVYDHVQKKFGENGYIRLYLNDKKNLKALKEIRKILKDKERFFEEIKRVNKL